MREFVSEAHRYASEFLGTGSLAGFIPELTKQDPNQLGISITTCQGELISIGDCEKMFTIQSISKLLLLAVAIEDIGFDAVFSKVGMEQPGDKFNSIYRMELMNPIPANPFNNSGAIMTSSCITGADVTERIHKVYRLAEACLGVDHITCSEAVFQCEVDTGHRNQALSYMMKDAGIMDGSVDDHLAVYYHACSMLVSSNMLSHFGATLANHGRTPGTNIQAIPAEIARLLRVLMSSCGLYNLSGTFAYHVGLPGKSGSSGGIMAAVPNKLGIATFSPLIDDKGNSICGMKALEYLSRNLDLSVF